MELSPLISEVAQHGPWALACAVLLAALYKLFGRYEDVQKSRIEDAKLSQEDSRKAMSLVSEMQPLLRDLNDELRRRRRHG